MTNKLDMGAPVVGVVAVDGAGFAEAMFEAQAQGAIVVPLRSANDAERIALTGVSRIVTPEAISGWVTPRPFPSGPADSPAAIVFSSGTTGTPKGVILTHGAIAAATDRLIAAMAMDGSIREYIGVPLIYSFGLGRARAIAKVGGRYFVPTHGFDPSEIAAMLRKDEINAISAVPTLWRVLLANKDVIGDAGAKVRWIEIGSQSMSADEKLAMKALFPNARIVQHYGLTEASRTTFLSIDSAPENRLGSVGQPPADTEIAIDGDGRIRIRGPHVAASCLKDGALVPLTDADGWLTTDDIGHIEDGWLIFESRADDQINCGGTKLHPDAIEAGILAAFPGHAASSIAVAKTVDPLRGDGIVLAYESGTGLTADALHHAANAVLEAHGLHAGGALHVVALDALPRTPTGKVQRREISAAFEAGHGASAEQKLVNIWRRVLGIDRIGPEDNFFDLGGDPLVGPALVDAMIAEGISANAAAGALDGMSISQILEASVAPASAGASGRSETEARLFALWGEALGRTDIDPHKSFYDVGGDSLSAIGLALAMEKAGFDGDTARAIFDGATISDIAEMSAPSAAPAEQPGSAPAAPRVRQRTQVALLNEGLNLVKGLLIVCIVASHWLPFYLNRVGLRDSVLHKALQPFLSMGSPTLAFTFGIGAAVFYARQYEGSGPAFRASVRSGVKLLLAGLAIGFAGEVAARLLDGQAANAAMFAASFVGGPFLYFMLATASLPLWVPHLRREWRAVWRTFAAALLFYAIFEALKLVLPPPGTEQVSSSVSEVLIGHWSLFQMGAITLAGGATGVLIELLLSSKRNLSVMAPAGLLLLVAGPVMALAAHDLQSWFEPHVDIIPWATVSYIGLALTMVARTESWIATAETRPMLRLFLQVVASIGVLLFPLYVVQSLVYHGAEIAVHLLNMKFLTALSVLILIFLALAAYAVSRIYRLYYGRMK